MESITKFRASKRGPQHRFTTAYGVVLHDQALVEKVEGYRKQHDMGVSRFFELAATAYFEEEDDEETA